MSEAVRRRRDPRARFRSDSVNAVADRFDLVGTRLRTLRERRGLTLTLAAQHGGMSRSTRSRLENRRPAC